MTNLPDPQDKLPKKTQSIVSRLWDNLPQADQEALKEVFKGLPLDTNPMNTLLDLVSLQYKMAKGSQKKVAIIGPANVGKSTLFNQFIRSKSDKAAVSPIPGTTRNNQTSDAGLFAIVDTPGADAIGNVGEQEREEAFDAASDADFLVLIFDAIQGIKRSELDLYHALLKLKKPHLIVLNKIDLAKKFRDDVLLKAAQNLELDVSEIIPVSALKGEGISKVVMSIAAADPELLISLGQALPKFRWKLAWRAIVTSASISAAIALTPLPVIDFIPLVITQTSMVITISRIYNYKITFKRAKELIATFGLGMLGRTLFQQLSKAGGLPGWLLSSAIATSMTIVMGYASIIWFEKGERLSQKTLKELGRKVTDYMVSSLRRKNKKRPNKKEMQQEIIDVLADSVLSDRESIEDKLSNP
ncbi:MAG: GTP-binding protein [Anaerolineaceae bacterium]|nr:GTP-binding protein [Anaerolineaceae bacterium]